MELLQAGTHYACFFWLLGDDTNGTGSAVVAIIGSSSEARGKLILMVLSY